MPNFDRTGPDGEGAMTGRGLGYCSSDKSCDNPLQEGFGRRNCRGGRLRKGPQETGRRGQMRRGRNR